MGKEVVLVTGGAGFIGSHIVRRLVGDGRRVRVIDDFSTGLRERIAEVEDQIELLECSITDRASCERAVREVDTVYHQAALPSVERSVEDPLTTHEVDASGTLNLLMAARDAGVARFVYAGSSSAYGDTDVLPKEEGLPAVPRSPYAVAKLTGEQYTRLFFWVYGLETVVLRYFNVFGPGQDPGSDYAAVVPLFISLALRNESPTINGDGEQTRDFTYVENVVDANLLASTAPADKVAGEVFNIGCGDRVSINQLWRIIRELSGASVDADHGPARAGLAATVEWFRNRP
jgi:nucleoside-diphosphate-sugar epimerase